MPFKQLVGGSNPSRRTMILNRKRGRCRNLRKQGFSLGRIVRITRLPKTTVWDQIKDIEFSKTARNEFEQYHRKVDTMARKRRKGHCWKGRVVFKPVNWSPELIYIISHFWFDGLIKRNCCEYYNTSAKQISKMRNYVKEIFGLKTSIKLQKNNVKKISYCYVELGEYILNKLKEMQSYIKIAPLEEKRIFLKSFFDDEGCIYFNGKYRKLRGYQHSKETLELIGSLLKDFDIESRINKRHTEICIHRKLNLIKFQEEINFSPGIYINPHRKNGIWKKKIEKRKILEKAISSYLD